MAAKTHDEFCDNQKSCSARRCVTCEESWNAAIKSERENGSDYEAAMLVWHERQ